MKSFYTILLALLTLGVSTADAQASVWGWPWQPIPPKYPPIDCPRVFPPPCSCDYYHQNPSCYPNFTPNPPTRPYPTPYPYPTFRPTQYIPVPEAQPPTYVPYPKYFPASNSRYPVSQVQCLAPCYSGYNGQFICPCERVNTYQ